MNAVIQSAVRLFDRTITITTAAGPLLVLPLSLLLFMQWPLRDWLGLYSREANDLAQILFALYVSLAITVATRHGTHLAADSLARRYALTTRHWLSRAAAMLVLVPWSLFMLYAAWPTVAASVRQLEGFPETFNHGYFVIKISILLLTSLVLLQAVVDVFRNRQHSDQPS